MRFSRHTEYIGSYFFTMAISLGLAPAVMGCWTEEPALQEATVIDSELVAMPTTEVLVRDSSYMVRLFEETSDGQPFFKIDLGDQRQYEFLVHRLLRAGKTPSNSPRLFQRLAESRAAHRTNPGEASTASGVGGGGVRCGHFMIANGEATGSTFNVSAHALVSCFGGMDFIALDQAVFHANEDETGLTLLASNYMEDFAGIEVRTPVLQASIPTGQGKLAIADSVGFASDDVTGEFEATYVRFKTEAETPAIIRENNSDTCCEFDHPRDSTGDGNIRLCYRRSFFAGLGDCDYVAVNALNQPGVPPFTHVAMIQLVAGLYVPSLTERWPIPGAPVSSVPNLFLPMMGVYDAGTKASNNAQCQIKQIKPPPDTYAAVTLRTTGGWCTGAGTDLPDDGGQLYNHLRTNFTALGGVPGNLNEIPFGEDLSSPLYNPNLMLDFGADCLQNLQDACLVMSISTRTNCNDPNNPGDHTRTATCEVCFDVRNSCFAEGTKIRRANGTLVPVEEVQVGDEIMATGTGTLLTVTAATRGVEPEPMVRLKDSLGHELMLTANHPVITTMGPVPADEITMMSQVETEDGIASIVEVERVPYDGMVYNLSVGTPEEIAMVSGVNRTMFAGGIRVGDNEMQFEMERQSKREGAERNLSPAWATDRKNAMAREQGVAKK